MLLNMVHSNINKEVNKTLASIVAEMLHIQYLHARLQYILINSKYIIMQ